VTEPEATTIDEDLDALLAANERFYAAFAAKDADAMRAVWARATEVTVTHPGWLPLQGRATVLASWRAIMENASQPRVVPGGAKGQVIGEVGIVHCREFVGGAALVATNIFVREQGAWRLIDHHASAVAMA
jgi:ketosteroid isomerase-like protein